MERNIDIDFTQSGCPYQNSYDQRFNRIYHEDVLDMYLFETSIEVREVTDEWAEMCNLNGYTIH